MIDPVPDVKRLNFDLFCFRQRTQNESWKEPLLHIYGLALHFIQRWFQMYLTAQKHQNVLLRVRGYEDSFLLWSSSFSSALRVGRSRIFAPAYLGLCFACRPFNVCVCSCFPQAVLPLDLPFVRSMCVFVRAFLNLTCRETAIAAMYTLLICIGAN